MGYWKDRQIKEFGQGWYFEPDDHFVCDDCFADYAIKEFVVDYAVNKQCTYCKRSSTEPIAAEMNQVLGLIGESLHFEYQDPDAEGVGWDSEEGGYLADVMQIQELFDVIEWPSQDEKIMDVIFRAFRDRAWVQRDFYALEEAEKLTYNWECFAELVKHESRYLFTLDTNSQSDPDHLTPAEMLNRIGDIVNDVNLFYEVKAGTRWFRARPHDCDQQFSTAADLGTPPQEKAIYSNRMSPAGIPMFYGAQDEETAVAETYSTKMGVLQMVTLGTFETARDFWVLDLTNIPEVPSLFDEHRRELRAGIKFLRGFVDDLAEPIQCDGREHIEYVPTQIVTEYFRRVFKPSFGREIHGILYKSSRKENGICCVLFFLIEHCCDVIPEWQKKNDNWLGLVQVSHRKEGGRIP